MCDVQVSVLIQQGLPTSCHGLYVFARGVFWVTVVMPFSVRQDLEFRDEYWRDEISHIKKRVALNTQQSTDMSDNNSHVKLIFSLLSPADSLYN